MVEKYWHLRIQLGIIFFSFTLVLFGQIAPCTNGPKCGYCKDGIQIIEKKYDKCELTEHGILKVSLGKKSGLIDTLGNVILPVDYQYIYVYKNVIITQQKDLGMLVKSKDGSDLVQHHYEKILKSSDESTNNIIIHKNKYGLLSDLGQLIHTATLDTIYQIKNHPYYAYRINDKYGILNLNGDVIHAPLLTKINKAFGDTIMVKHNDEWWKWNSMDSSYSVGQFSDPIPDKNPCYACITCNTFTEYKDIKTCSDIKLLTFIQKNLSYPPLARQNGIKGTVLVEFTVNIDGNTSDFIVLNSLGFGCDESALELCKKIKFEQPGIFENSYINSKYKLPLKFTFK